MPIQLNPNVAPNLPAIADRAGRTSLPMGLSTREYQQKLSQAVKSRATFMAKNQNAGSLDLLNTLITKIVGGPDSVASGERTAERRDQPMLLDIPQAKLELQDYLVQSGYKPKAGEEGTLTDLTSERRVDLVLKTNIDTTLGYVNWSEGQDQDVLDMWPAWELYRLTDPLGEKRDWLMRWRLAGGKLFGERMIALKNSEVWNKLGDPGLFDDGLGNPYPPFAFSSGMDVKDVTRAECIRLGVIEKGQPGPAPIVKDLNEGLEVKADKFSAALADVLANDPDLTMDNGVLRLAEGEA
jgi:hypothetical protein